MELLEWWNLIYILPFSAALLYLLLLASGLAASGGSDADADVDADVEADAGIEHSVLQDHASGEGSVPAKALSFLGIGRVPLSLILLSFCFVWGFAGVASNQVLRTIPGFGGIFMYPAVVIALLASAFTTRYLAYGLARVVRSTESYA